MQTQEEFKLDLIRILEEEVVEFGGTLADLVDQIANMAEARYGRGTDFVEIRGSIDSYKVPFDETKPIAVPLFVSNTANNRGLLALLAHGGVNIYGVQADLEANVVKEAEEENPDQLTLGDAEGESTEGEAETTSETDSDIHGTFEVELNKADVTVVPASDSETTVPTSA